MRLIPVATPRISLHAGPARRSLSVSLVPSLSYVFLALYTPRCRSLSARVVQPAARLAPKPPIA